MSEHIIWTIEARIREESEDLLNAVMRSLIDASREEPGTLNYEWTISEDDRTVHIYERYAHEEAAMDHLKIWARHAMDFFTAAEVTKFTIFSVITEELKQAVAGEGTIYMRPIDGFTR